MIPLLPAERGTISQYIYSLCGVSLDDSKDYLIEGRLGGLAERAGCGSFTQFVAHAKRDPSKVLERRIIDAITTNETLFFRDSSPFELLRYKIVPELIDRQTRASGAKIRIWGNNILDSGAKWLHT